MVSNYGLLGLLGSVRHRAQFRARDYVVSNYGLVLLDGPCWASAQFRSAKREDLFEHEAQQGPPADKTSDHVATLWSRNEKSTIEF